MKKIVLLAALFAVIGMAATDASYAKHPKTSSQGEPLKKSDRVETTLPEEDVPTSKDIPTAKKKSHASNGITREHPTNPIQITPGGPGIEVRTPKKK